MQIFNFVMFTFNSKINKTHVNQSAIAYFVFISLCLALFILFIVISFRFRLTCVKQFQRRTGSTRCKYNICIFVYYTKLYLFTLIVV